MSAHTPGPWKVVDKIDGRKPRSMALVAAGGDMSIDCTRSGDTRAESNANARLIAAAPDLLAELEHLVRLLEPLEQSGSLQVPGLATLNGARAAIAKAQP